MVLICSHGFLLVLIGSERILIVPVGPYLLLVLLDFVLIGTNWILFCAFWFLLVQLVRTGSFWILKVLNSSY